MGKRTRYVNPDGLELCIIISYLMGNFSFKFVIFLIWKIFTFQKKSLIHISGCKWNIYYMGLTNTEIWHMSIMRAMYAWVIPWVIKEVIALLCGNIHYKYSLICFSGRSPGLQYNPCNSNQASPATSPKIQLQSTSGLTKQSWIKTYSVGKRAW